MSVTPLKYETVQFAIIKINECLLSSGKALLIQVTVNNRNEIVAADVVSVQTALARGFEPCKMLPKGQTVAKTDS